MASSGPKAQLRVAGRSLLEHVIQSALPLGARRIIVCCGESEDWRLVVSNLYPNIVEAIRSSSDRSSVSLVKECLENLSDRVIFMYGHAPRPTSHLLALVQITSPFVATSVKSSTRQDAISREDRYLEPPYVFSKKIIRPEHQTWRDVIQSCNVSVVPICGPGEFNYLDEFRDYDRYVCTNFD